MAMAIEDQYRMVVARVRKLIGTPRIDWEGLVQDIVVECWQKQCDPSWVMIRHRCYDALRKYLRDERMKHITEFMEASLVKEDTSWEIGNEVLLDELVDRADLDERERAVLRARFYREASDREIAGNMDIPIVEVSRLYVRAIEKLQLAAEDTPHEEDTHGRPKHLGPEPTPEDSWHSDRDEPSDDEYDPIAGPGPWGPRGPG